MMTVVIALVLVALGYYFGRTGIMTGNQSGKTQETILSAPSSLGYIAPKPLFTSKRDKYDVIDKFSAGVQVSYFRQLLGDPVYINYAENSDYREFIFVDPDFYVQLITDRNEKVLTFAVTSRVKDFNPPVGRFFGEKVVLNQTKFGDIPDDTYGSPEACHLFPGITAPSYYFEEYGFGYPGLYQTIYFGINSAGYYPEERLPGTKPTDLGETETCSEVDQDTRNDLTFNTYMVQHGDVPIGMDEEDSFIYGPRYTEVKTLNE